MRIRFAIGSLLLAALQSMAAPVDFNREVLPVLADTCFTCHGPDEKARKAKLRLDEKEGLFSLREAGAVIVPGNPEQSLLWQKITHPDGEERMPPPGELRQLTGQQKELIKRWIEEGAAWSRHWAFMPPEEVSPPKVKDHKLVKHPIDRFILSRLEQEGFSLSVEAPKHTLIRRLSLDLTGLPPTPEEVTAFVNDKASDAYERLVDRLLASPRYGEHMAGPWLEAARYADSDGYQNDRWRDMWVWRDWVVYALNRNMPFDRFTLEQLAGDMLPDRTRMTQIASGFNRNHRINSEAGSHPEEFLVEYVVDRVDTTSTVWLGLTMGCARCHDHKYDPISQKEYFQLYAFFNNVPEWGLGCNNGNSPPFIKVPESFPNFSEEEMAFVEPEPMELKKSQGAVIRPLPGSNDTLMVMHEMEEPRETYLLNRGLYDQPDKSERLFPEIPEIFGGLPERFPKNRLGLAQWLMDPENPLTARVIVNRYWQHFFEKGLVRTSENFGFQGEPPSHPELLDWLAREFIALDWDVKALQKQILMSATYRQVSKAFPEMLEYDPENRWLGRAPRYNLPPFVLRDQALFMGGLLVEDLGGVPVKPYLPKGLWEALSNKTYKQDEGEKLYRRSLYTYWLRTLPPPTMMTLGAADREACTVRKSRITTPMQALTQMNNITFVEASRRMAERMMKEGGRKPGPRLEYGFRLALSRVPSPTEKKALMQVYRQVRKAYKGRRDDAEKLLGTGESPRDPDLPLLDLAAYTVAANTILNLDEAVTRE